MKHYIVRISEKAYNYLHEYAKAEEFAGRGIVGAIDKIIFGEFTTPGIGRPPKKGVDVK